MTHPTPVPAVQYWFPVTDVSVLAAHKLTHSPQPALQLFTQGHDGHLVFLGCAGPEQPLTDLRDGSSWLRVYAIGHAHQVASLTIAADPHQFGEPVPVALFPFGPHEESKLGWRLRSAERQGCPWLVLTCKDGQWTADTSPLPRPAAVAHWITGNLSRLGQLRRYRGEFPSVPVGRAGWIEPRFGKSEAARVLADAGRLTDTTHLARLHLRDDGWWKWVCPDLLPAGTLTVTAPTSSPIPQYWPEPGEVTYACDGIVYWVAGEDRHLYFHYGPGDPDVSVFDPSGLDADVVMRLTAIWHHLLTHDQFADTPPFRQSPSPGCGD